MNDLIGIIGAMDVEIERITNKMTDVETRVISGIKFTKGKINGGSAVCAVCGIGKVFAAVCAQTMILNYSPCCIINTGVAGALSKELKVLDTVVAQSVCQHDMDTSFLGDPPGLVSGINIINFDCDASLSEKLCHLLEKNGFPYKRGIIASGDVFVADGDKKTSIAHTFKASACEMEGGAIGQVCYINNIPFSVLRTLSDGADADAGMDYMTFRDIAAEKSANIIIDFISSYKNI